MAYICNKNISCANCEHYRFDVNKMKYCCFATTNHEAEKTKKKFMLLQVSFEKIKDNFDMDDYCVVYETFIETKTSLEELFEMFNLNHPSDYEGRSMSVSDLIYFPETDELYYVDTFGFVDLNYR